jgi:EthD domain-containing protein
MTMVKLMAAVRRRDGLTHAEFCSYAVDVHARKVLAGHELPRRYVQNHVLDGSYGRLGPRDSVIELWFDDLEAVNRTQQSDYYREVVEPDEHNLGDHSDAVLMLAREVVREPTQVRHRGRKVLCFLKRDDRLSRASFTERLVSQPLLAQRRSHGIVYSLPLTSDPVPAGADLLGGGRLANEYDAVATHWFDPSAADALVAVRTAYFDARAADGGELVDPASSFFVDVDEVVLKPE